jgi:hypothetical protein
MNTDERIHACSRNFDTVNSLKGGSVVLADIQKLRQLNIDDYYMNTRYSIQKHLNEEIIYGSIKILSSYCFNIFEAIKLVNGYWKKIYNFGINNKKR